MNSSFFHKKILLYCYGISVVALFFYSFTQVDLSLTLSRASFFQEIQKSFQYIGYFARPLSTYLFIGIILFLYFFYTVLFIKIKQFTMKQIWGIILFSAILLGFSYNALSYDLFNYIFDAKIVTHYQQNPYEHKALDYSGDPMLSFMRWTHRVYPYGPVWLAITIPLSYLGFNYFLLTFFIFKVLMVTCFLGTVWFLGKILQKINPQYEKLGILFFALNPFVLIESVVSAHNDIVMLFFMSIGMYLLVQKKYFLSIILIVLSYGIKFASAEIPTSVHLLIIVLLCVGFFIFSKIQKKLSWEVWFLLAGACMVIPIVLASLRTNFQPWYILSLLPFVALVSQKMFVRVPFIIISLFALFEYVPYLYLGNWDAPVPTYLFLIRITGLSIAFLSFLFCLFLVRNKKNGTISSL